MNLNPNPKRSNYRWRRKSKKTDSLRYESILGGAVLKYHDGRETCQPSPAGAREYRRRIEAMAQRQELICCICKDPKNILLPWNMTFEHENLRGLGGAFRDDRIEDENGQPMNGAAHFDCNMKKGSKRI